MAWSHLAAVPKSATHPPPSGHPKEASDGGVRRHLGKVSGHPEFANLAAIGGLSQEQVERAVAALGKAHQQPGDTMQQAAAQTGIASGIVGSRRCSTRMATAIRSTTSWALRGSSSARAREGASRPSP